VFGFAIEFRKKLGKHACGTGNTHAKSATEMITEPDCRSGLRPEFAIWAAAGAGAGVNILG